VFATECDVSRLASSAGYGNHPVTYLSTLAAIWVISRRPTADAAYYFLALLQLHF
jgi:hypothetical protein